MKKLKLEELNRKSLSEYKNSLKLPITIVLDNVRSMHNVGSVFRTCDAFLTEEIILCGITAVPPHREITKTALGATESVKWSYRQDIVELLKESASIGYINIGVEQTDKSIFLGDFLPEPEKKYILVFGNEITGISEEAIPMLDISLEIPQYGTKHSLNISVAAGIVIQYFCNGLMKGIDLPV